MENITEQKNGEHSITNYNIFLEYTKLIEELLENFVEISKHSAEEIYESCNRIKEVDENYLTCLDYILSANEYECFYNMIMEYKVIIFNFRICIIMMWILIHFYPI